MTTTPVCSPSASTVLEGQDFRRPAPPRGLDQIPGSLASDASVQICEFTDLRRIIMTPSYDSAFYGRSILHK